MKKVLFYILLAFFTSIFFSSQVYAQTPSTTENSNSSTQSAKTSVNYQLAFPGILPDSPFYKLKVLRDKIILKTLKDPSKKISFYALQADKQLLAASMLVEKGNIKLAKETALKGENNYSLIVREFYNTKTKPTKKQFDLLKNASLKHQEVIKIMIKRVKTEDQATFKNVLYFSETNLKMIEKLFNG